MQCSQSYEWCSRHPSPPPDPIDLTPFGRESTRPAGGSASGRGTKTAQRTVSRNRFRPRLVRPPSNQPPAEPRPLHRVPSMPAPNRTTAATARGSRRRTSLRWPDRPSRSNQGVARSRPFVDLRSCRTHRLLRRLRKTALKAVAAHQAIRKTAKCFPVSGIAIGFDFRWPGVRSRTDLQSAYVELETATLSAGRSSAALPSRLRRKR